MKILSITHLVPYPLHGGVRIRNFNLLKQLAKRHEVHLLTFYQQAHISGDASLQKNIDVVKQFCKEMQVYRIPSDGHPISRNALLALNLLSPAPYSAWLYHSRDMIHAVRATLKEHKFDAMEIGEIGLAEYTRLAPDLPKVLVHHNIESQLLKRRSQGVDNPLARFYLARQAEKLERFERKTATTFACHTTCSENDKQTLLKINPNARVEVIPNGVDVDFFQPPDDSAREKSVVWVGGMAWFPNLDAMKFFSQSIWPLLKAQVPGIEANIIGKGTTEKLADYAKGDAGLKLHGLVDDIRPPMGKAAAYVVPIRVGGGTRLKILDAMAMGKAIVSTSVGCEGIEVVDGENILIADTPEEFAAKTAAVLDNAELRKKLERNARRTAEEKYSWDIIGPKLCSVFERAAAGEKTHDDGNTKD